MPGGPFADGGIIADKYQTEIDQQTAGFVDVTWNIAAGWKAAAGVRVGRESYGYEYIGNGLFQGGEQILPKTDTSTTVVNPRFTSSYQITDDDMAYVSVAKGDRPGGINRPIPAARCALDISEAGGSTPQTYTDDSVWSYELGTKDRFLDRKLAIDGSVYYLKWHDVQQALSLTNCGFSYVGNFGSATSKGFDLSARFAPVQSVEFGIKAGLTDTELSESVLGSVNATTGVAPVLAIKGSALDLVPKWTADADVELRRPLPWESTAGFARVDYTYQGSFRAHAGDRLNPVQPRQLLRSIVLLTQLQCGCHQELLAGNVLYQQRHQPVPDPVQGPGNRGGELWHPGEHVATAGPSVEE